MNWIKIVYLENYSEEWPRIEHKDGNCCFDLRAAILESKCIWPGKIEKIPLGIKIELPTDHSLKIYPRSGLSINGLTLVNNPGIVDPAYRGQIYAGVINLSQEKIWIEPGDRIVQAELQPVVQTIFRVVTEQSLGQTWRGANGFGSTGR